MNDRVRTAVLSIVAVSAIYIGVWQSTAMAGVIAHRAVYDLTLKNAQDRAGIEGLEGRMVVNVENTACKTWSLTVRMVNRYYLKDGRTRIIDNESSSVEASDGRTFRFTQSQQVDGRIEQDVNLMIDRQDRVAEAIGKLLKPSERDFKVAPGALFPVAHQEKLLQTARAGGDRDRSIVFSGSEDAKSELVVTVFSDARSDFKEEGDGFETLHGLASWSALASYFTLTKGGDETPSYQVQFKLFENGVAGDLTIQYKDFSIAGELSKVEVLDAPNCN